MRKKFFTKRYFQLFAVIGCAFALKLHYSTASVNDLRWILAPTTFLVELISGRTFAFESYAGYMSSDHTFLIAASCAGVNFFITAFLLLTLKRLWTNRSGSWTFIPVAGFVAFIATLFANTIRISIALQLQRNPLNLEWLSPDQFHRLEGICVYFGVLMLLYVGSERLIYGARSRRLMPESVETVARVPWSVSVLGLLFPLLVYYITTLGFPLINGAFRLENFWEHALFVLLAPLFFYLPFAAVRVAFQIRRQR